MTAEERRRVLDGIDQGKITVEQGIALLERLMSEDARAEEMPGESAAGPGSAGESPRWDEVRARVRRWSRMALWAGIGLVILSATGMFWRLQTDGIGVWFLCLMAPFLFGVGWIAWAGGRVDG